MGQPASGILIQLISTSKSPTLNFFGGTLTSQPVITLSTAANQAVKEMESAVQDAISGLLEDKHLYQRSKVDYAGILAKYLDVVPTQSKNMLPTIISQRMGGILTLERESRRHTATEGPTYILKNLKLYCADCGEREVYKCLWTRDICAETGDDGYSLAQTFPLKNQYQGFFLAYQCQRCKSDPMLFLIRRQNWSFILDGRSPIEEVSIPKEIPKTEAKYFRDSVVAFQSGKALPAILYLRVFIEAFCRRVTGTQTRETGDELTDRYAKQLSEQQRSQMPSLKDWYGRLSEAIHDGREDIDLYTEARDEIVRHFEFRRLFRLVEPSTATTH
jgi:hypothetical protein